jgi:hypothetical protein
MVNERWDWSGHKIQSSLAYSQGLQYLQTMQRLALDPAMVNVLHTLPDQLAIVAWIGQHQNTLNAQLKTYVQACHECFHPHARPQVQIFAVPLAAAFGFDGLCNAATHPTTILVDLGRVLPRDWLRLVIHEYAHAQVDTPGHHDRFVATLSHLCLGLGIELPLPTMPDPWPHWPPCQSTVDPLAFWRGLTPGLMPDH